MVSARLQTERRRVAHNVLPVLSRYTRRGSLTKHVNPGFFLTKEPVTNVPVPLKENQRSSVY